MSEGFQPSLDFDAANTAAADGEALIIDLDGYEGPLHVLLALARTQKVDLLKLSVLKLAEQYLAFVQEARRRRFSLAADYLVMAAWLAYLKSRLLLPKPEQPKPEEAPAEEVAARLAFRLANGGKEWDDKEVERDEALKSIMRWVRLHPYNISQKVQRPSRSESIRPVITGIQ